MAITLRSINRKCFYLLLFITAGCARSMNPDIERGADLNYSEESSQVRISALGFLNLEDQAVIQVSTDITYGTLTFNTIDGEEVANVSITVRTINKNTGQVNLVQEDFRINSGRELFEISEELFTYTEEIEVEPGEYSVVVAFRDEFADKEYIRQTEAFVPDPTEHKMNLTDVRLSGKTNTMRTSTFSPLTMYNITSSLDSLRFDFQVTNDSSDEPLTIRSRLIRYHADLTPSDPMSDVNPSTSEIEYKGIDYREYTVVDETVRYLEQPGSVMIEFKYPVMDNGNYRFEVRTLNQDNEDLYKARDFAVRRDNFPTLLTARELAEPLIYLMNSNQYDQLMSIEDPEQIKEMLDRFWLSNIGSMRRARLVIKQYYDRVEKANKQFTNFKEGWKTDRGKIYILFGPPWYSDKSMNRLMWSYTHSMSDPEYNLVFTQPSNVNEFFPFEHYLLERKTAYHRLEYRQKQLWLSGSIIERSK